MRFIAVGIAAGLLVLAGCGGSKKSTSGGAASTPTATSKTLTVKEREPAANQYAYEGLHAISGGTVTIKFSNGGKAPHELQLVRLDAGHTASELVSVLKQLASPKGGVEPPWLHPAGGVGVTFPGDSETATVTLPPGQYYALDTQSGQGNNAPPFFTQGALAAFSVQGGGAGGPLPATTAKITAKDLPGMKHAFAVSGLKQGKLAIEFDNTGKEDHHVVALPLLPGATPAALKKALASNGPPSGPPPADFQHATSAAVLAHKTKQVAQLNFAKPGTYVLVCFLKDRNGKGKPHFLEGMFKQVTIQ